MSYKRSAKARNINWCLSDEEFNSFWGKPCSYCDEPINTIGIDRLDNSIGYLFENCTSCCSICNYMKMTFTKTEFIVHITKILKNLKEIK